MKLSLFIQLLSLFIFTAGCLNRGTDSIPGVEIPSGGNQDSSVYPTARLYIVSGNFQVGAPSLPFSLPLRVQCLKAPGVPAVGSQIGFSLSSFDATGSFSLASVTADSQGIGQTYFTPGSTTGTVTIQAYCDGMTADFSLTVANQSDITLSYVSGNSQIANVGTALQNHLVVKASKVSNSQPAENIFVRFQVLSGNGNIFSQNSYTGVTNAFGEISVPFNVGTIAGANSVVALNVADPSQQFVFTATGVVPLNSVSLARSTIYTTSGPPTEDLDSILQANGLDFVKVKVQLKDVYGNNYPYCGDTITTYATDGSLSGSFSCVDGLYSGQNLTAPTSKLAPQITLSGTYNGNPISSTHQISLVSGAFDKDTSQVTTAASSILANGTSTTLVTVTLKDSFGNQLTSGGETVVVSTNGGALIGSPGVVDNNNGTYTIVLRSSTTAQTVTLSATAGGISITDNATVHFAPGACDPTQSSLIASKSILSPGPGSLANITLVCKDINGNNLTSSPGGTAPVFSTDLGGFISGVTDLNNGTYQITYEASSSSGLATIRASLGGVYLPTSATIFVTTSISPPSPVFSILTLNQGVGPFAADGACSYSLTLQTKDNAGNNISTGGFSVVFNLPPEMSKVGSVLDQNNGSYSQTICAPSSSLKDARITVTVDDTDFYSEVVRSFYGAPSLSASEIVVFPAAIEANGTSTTLLYADFKDENGIEIPNGGLGTVVFNVTNGTLIGSVSDNSNGSYSQYIRSTASPAVALVTATLNGDLLSDSASVEFFSVSNLAGTLIDCTNISSYNNRPVVVDNGTLTMNTFGPNGSCESSFVFTSIILRNAATITHTATGTGSSEYGLSLRASSINIDGTSKIDVSQKGISNSTANFKVPSLSGPTSVNGRQGTSGNCIGGASYGGDGGGANSARSYGSVFRPFDSGMSSSCANVFGGGRVKLVVDSSLTLNGSILARGQNGTAGAAGGSIWIQANSIEGNGSISATGGAGSTTGGGGGGGRIAIYANNFSNNFSLPVSFGANVVASGGVATFGPGAAGTIIVKAASDTYASLIIDNKNTVTTAVTEIKAPAAAVPNAISSTNLTQSGNFADTYSNINPYIDWYIDPSTTQNASASKNDNILFRVTGVPDINTVVSAGNMSAITNSGVAPAELVLVLDNLDLKGASLISTSAQVLVKKGDLSSGSNSSAVLVGLPSSRIEFVNSSLDIDLGGRIWTASQSVFNRDLIVRNGTLNFENDVNLGEYSFSSYSVTSSMPKIVAKNLYLNASSLTVTQCSKGSFNVNISGAMEVVSTSTVSHAATSSVAFSPECTLEITAQSVNVSAGSAIHADAKGFLAATPGTCRVAGNKDITTTFFGSTISTANAMYLAAAHGGRGGMHSNHIGTGSSMYWGNEVYGSFVDPTDSGASCYGHTSYGVTRGGGVVRITTTSGDLINNGRISANGASDINNRHGAAGGSVYVNTNALSGPGTFESIGAGLGVTTSAGGGGGGGRIALYYNSLSGGIDIGAQTNASGGGTIGYSIAPAGTVFHRNKSAATGTLIIDNKGKVALGPTYFYTPILVPTLGQETLASASATNVVVSTASSQLGYSTPYLKGLYLNPHEAQNNTASLLDDTNFEITDQVGSALTLNGDARTISAGVNSAASFVLKLTNLEVKGKGQAFLPPVIAESVVLNDATVTIRSRRLRTALNVTGDLTVSNNSFLQQEASTIFSEPEYSLDVLANNILIDATSTVTAEGRGYFTPTNSTCMVAGKTIITTNIRNETNSFYNASHGGYAPTSAVGKTNEVYGSIAYPYWSGASCDWGGNRRAGGGIIKLKALSTLTLNGAVKANALGSSSEGNAAGGSVIIDAPTFQGTGSVDASGGIGSSSWGGGGGRIAVYYSSSTFSLDNIYAYGGGNGAGAGGAGTVYYRDTDELYGSLKIKNRGFYPSAGVNLPTTVHTPLVLPSGLSASSSSLSVSSDVVTLNSSQLDYGLNTEKLRGLFLIPNPGLNATLTATDDQMVEIVQQPQGNSIQLKSNPLTVSGPNGNVEFALVLKNLEIGAGGVFAPSGTILVKEGDENSGDTTSFRIIKGSITYPMNSSGTALRNLKLEFQGLQNFTAQSDSRLTLGYPLAVGSNLSFDASTLLLDTPRGTNVSVGGNLSLNNASHFYHAGILETGLDRAIEVEVGGNATIDSLSSFNAEASGLQMFMGTAGNQTIGCRISPTLIVGSNTAYWAAPHGGAGQTMTNTAGYPSTYGSWAEPTMAGASCGAINQHNGQVGGGVIRLFVNGTLNLNGTLNSNAQQTTSGSAGGAGGSIWVKTSTLNGSGIMRANGGRSSTWGHGGGGGRIAVYYDTLGTFGFSNIEAFGGANGIYSGAAGTIFVKQNSEALGTMIINNNGNFATAGNQPKTFLTLPDTSSMTISGSSVSLSSNQIENTLMTGHLKGLFINPNPAANSTSTLSDDTFVRVADHSSATQLTLASTPGSVNTTSGNPFVCLFKNLEVKNGGVFSPSFPCLVTEGDLGSNDSSTVSFSGGQVVGAGVEFMGLSSISLSSNASLTLARPLSIPGTLSLNSSSLTVTSSLTTVPGIQTGGDIILSSGSTLTHLELQAVAGSPLYRLYVEARDVEIDATSSINVTGRGYKYALNYAGYSNACAVGPNHQYQNSLATPANCVNNAGGSHGGVGAGNIGWGYGSMTAPIFHGGTGAWNGQWGGSGGGVIRIKASRNLIVNGTIEANGSSPSTWAGGAGGSIWIEADELSGSGSIRANGGPSSQICGAGGRISLRFSDSSGNFAYPVQIVGSVHATAATPGCGAGAGTIYVYKVGTSTFGDLIAKNNGVTAALTQTVLPVSTSLSAVSGLSSTMTSNTLGTVASSFSHHASQIGAASEGNHFQGLCINPNTANNVTAKLSDDVLFQIMSNSIGLVTTGMGFTDGVSTGEILTDVASTGQNFRAVACFDNLQISGGARLHLDRVYVAKGDLVSNNDTTFLIDGVLNTNVLDVSSSSISTSAGSSYSGATAVCSANINTGGCP